VDQPDDLKQTEIVVDPFGESSPLHLSVYGSQFMASLDEPEFAQQGDFLLSTQALSTKCHCRTPLMAQHCPLQIALRHLQALNTQPQPQQNRLKNLGQHL
jgi:hypothetical protein